MSVPLSSAEAVAVVEEIVNLESQLCKPNKAYPSRPSANFNFGLTAIP